jgi:hypothetical protein
LLQDLLRALRYRIRRHAVLALKEVTSLATFGVQAGSVLDVVLRPMLDSLPMYSDIRTRP